MGAAKRQLLLPGLPRSSASRGRPLKRARRDLSAAAFTRALERNGFRQDAGGLFFVDVRGGCARPLQGIYRTDPLRIARRATLAKIIREREVAPAARTESQKESQ